MFLTNLTRELGIGANSYLLETGGLRLLLDAGMHPKAAGEAATPDFTQLDPAGCDAIFLTHAHQDHVGCLPLAMRLLPDCPVHMTPATAAVASVMLHNSVNVMMKQRESLDLPDYPLFAHREVERASAAWQHHPLGRRFDAEGQPAREMAATPSFEFFDAGHILGSAGLLIRSEGRRIFYTGDVNFEDQTLMRGARFPVENIDTVIMETTRGDSPMAPGANRHSEEERLLQALEEALAADAPVLIPVFALGKTQELLALLHRWRKTRRLRSFGLVIGGLSTKITQVYDRERGSAPRHLPDLRLAECLPMETVGGPDMAGLAVRGRCIYALSSGMMTENTLSNVLAPRFLENPEARLFFVGYSDPASPAGRIRAAQPGDEVQLDPRNRPVRLRCRVDNFTLSAHANREDLLGWLAQVRPRKTVLVHGDRAALEWFARSIPAACPETSVLLPEPGVRHDLRE